MSGYFVCVGICHAGLAPSHAPARRDTLWSTVCTKLRSLTKQYSLYYTTVCLPNRCCHIRTTRRVIPRQAGASRIRSTPLTKHGSGPRDGSLTYHRDQNSSWHHRHVKLSAHATSVTGSHSGQSSTQSSARFLSESFQCTQRV